MLLSYIFSVYLPLLNFVKEAEHGHEVKERVLSKFNELPLVIVYEISKFLLFSQDNLRFVNKATFKLYSAIMKNKWRFYLNNKFEINEISDFDPNDPEIKHVLSLIKIQNFRYGLQLLLHDLVFKKRFKKLLKPVALYFGRSHTESHEAFHIENFKMLLNFVKAEVDLDFFFEILENYSQQAYYTYSSVDKEFTSKSYKYLITSPKWVNYYQKNPITKSGFFDELKWQAYRITYDETPFEIRLSIDDLYFFFHYILTCPDIPEDDYGRIYNVLKKYIGSNLDIHPSNSRKRSFACYKSLIEIRFGDQEPSIDELTPNFTQFNNYFSESILCAMLAGKYELSARLLEDANLFKTVCGCNNFDEVLSFSPLVNGKLDENMTAKIKVYLYRHHHWNSFELLLDSFADYYICTRIDVDSDDNVSFNIQLDEEIISLFNCLPDAKQIPIHPKNKRQINSKVAEKLRFSSAAAFCQFLNFARRTSGEFRSIVNFHNMKLIIKEGLELISESSLTFTPDAFVELLKHPEIFDRIRPFLRPLSSFEARLFASLKEESEIIKIEQLYGTTIGHILNELIHSSFPLQSIPNYFSLRPAILRWFRNLNQSNINVVNKTIRKLLFEMLKNEYHEEVENIRSVYF